MKLKQIALLNLALISQVFALDIQPQGTIDYNLSAHVDNSAYQAESPHKIKLLHFKLSEKALKAMADKLTSAKLNKMTVSPMTSGENQLGMGNVPVLDQGAFGSCVTFATTAAMDAAMGKGDHISQLCLLQLGNYYVENAYQWSGWDGANGREILTRLEDHGYVTKLAQRLHGCGGLTEYPDNADPTPSESISFMDYRKISKSLDKQGIFWSPIFDTFDNWESINTKPFVDEIKQAIDNNHRVTIGVFIPLIDIGLAGAVGKNHVKNDTWVLSTLIEREILLHLNPDMPGHEMIITGYDDNAVAVDDTGRKHKGLFTLRNSWGDGLGDHGDFYMSYDYFRVTSWEATKIGKDGD